jgi:hypothetical protein
MCRAHSTQVFPRFSCKNSVANLYRTSSSCALILHFQAPFAADMLQSVWRGMCHAYRLLVGKPEGKRPLGRPRRRWVDNIRMELGEVRWNDVDSIGLAQDRVP